MNPNHNHLASALLRLANEAVSRAPVAAAKSSSHGITTPFSTASQSDWAEAVRLWNENGSHLIAGLAKRPCPACGQNDARSLFQSYDRYTFVECIPCGCWYVPQKVEAELFERFFSETPKAVEVMQRTLEGRRTEASRLSNLERIGAYLDQLIPLLSGTSGLRYLDMGCGLGQSLEAAQARGLQASGVESSRECITIASQAGLQVCHVSDNGLRQQKFNLISFWESLEHMVEPAAVLQDCLQHMAPNSLLAFTVPNQNSPPVRSQRGDCSVVNGGYDTPGHINLFNPETIERLLDRSGYTLLALDGQYGLDLSELISYFLGKQRGAYDLLQGRAVQSGLTEENHSLLRAIGPAYALLERITLTAPILFGFACRKGDAGHFASAVAQYKNKRRNQLLEQIDQMSPMPGDVALLQHQLTEAEGRIHLLEDELRVARNPLRRLVRFVRKTLNPPKS
ncbi:MAG: class I SAM-dependent methyltransferase [Burkholderiales bacterium]|nr:class I SAM-dependent methyltransferase [Burkholderiales bacterium]